jgi:hypothetical protein
MSEESESEEVNVKRIANKNIISKGTDSSENI